MVVVSLAGFVAARSRVRVRSGRRRGAVLTRTTNERPRFRHRPAFFFATPRAGSTGLGAIGASRPIPDDPSADDRVRAPAEERLALPRAVAALREEARRI